MSEGPLKNRFSAAIEQLRQSTAVKPEETTGLGKFKRRETAEQNNISARADFETTEIAKIWNDSSLDPKEKAEKIAVLLTADPENPEANAKAIADNQAAVAALLKQFIDHNKSSIELTRDNPLSELRSGIREVFDEYHELNAGRDDLKNKLSVIDDIITKHGGAEGLIKALLTAKDKELEKAALDRDILAERERVEKLSGDVRGLDTNAMALQSVITDNESDSWLLFKGDKKRKIAEDKEKKAMLDADLSMKRGDLTSATSSLDAKTTALSNFMATEDYQVHQQILSVLDIGTDEFKQKLTDLSSVTLSYIDNTTNTLEGVGNQLKVLLDRVTGIHTLTQNTVENVSILQEAQEIAQRNNARKLQEIEAEEVTGGTAAMKRDKKIRAMNTHVSALERTTQSTSSVGGELGKVQISLTNFKDQMQEGLADAMEQQMLAVGSAAMNGNSTLMRIESLATFVQGLMSKGQYMRDAEIFLGDIAKEMERSIMSRMAKNEGIKNMADVMKELTGAMDDKNDVVLQLAEDRKGLIDRLIKQSEELGKTNEAALAIESTINKQVYLKDLVEPDGQPKGGAPSAPSLG